MKWIVITTPDFRPAEAEEIVSLLESVPVLLHLRKPGATADECRALLRRIPACFYERIVLHDHFALHAEFGLRGVHLNGRNPFPPEGFAGQLSASCHSLEELARRREEGFDYLFLSPVFDSISKAGYSSAFSAECLRDAARRGIIREDTVALGGICPENVAQLPAYGFGGAAVLGYAWQGVPADRLRALQEALR